MSDLLTREEQLCHGDFEQASMFSHMPAVRRQFIDNDQQPAQAEEISVESDAIQLIPGQEDLLAKAYRPIRELGSKGIIHMVKTYVHDVKFQEWPKSDR